MTATRTLGDAQVFPFERDVFDIAVSSFGTMFFNDPVAAYTNIGGGLRRNGTLIATTENDGAYTDALGKRKRGLNFTYQVCQEGSTTICSNEVTVTS